MGKSLSLEANSCLDSQELPHFTELSSLELAAHPYHTPDDPIHTLPCFLFVINLHLQSSVRVSKLRCADKSQSYDRFNTKNFRVKSQYKISPILVARFGTNTRSGGQAGLVPMLYRTDSI